MFHLCVHSIRLSAFPLSHLSPLMSIQNSTAKIIELVSFRESYVTFLLSSSIFNINSLTFFCEILHGLILSSYYATDLSSDFHAIILITKVLSQRALATLPFFPLCQELFPRPVVAVSLHLQIFVQN